MTKNEALAIRALPEWFLNYQMQVREIGDYVIATNAYDLPLIWNAVTGWRELRSAPLQERKPPSNNHD